MWLVEVLGPPIGVPLRVSCTLSAVAYTLMVVAAVGVALAALVGGEVKHVPDEGSPEIGAGLDLPPVGLVEQRLVLLRVEVGVRYRLGRVLLVLDDAGAGAVLAERDPPAGERGVQVVQEAADVVVRAVVPAVVPVVAHHLGVVVQAAGDRAVVCVRGEPIRVLGV